MYAFKSRKIGTKTLDSVCQWNVVHLEDADLYRQRSAQEQEQNKGQGSTSTDKELKIHGIM